MRELFFFWVNSPFNCHLSITKCASQNSLISLAQGIPDLEDLLIQETGSKDSDALGVQDWVVATRQSFCNTILAVKDQSDVLLLHRNGNAVPPIGREEILKV